MLDETQDVSVGDLRYNVMNLLPYKELSGNSIGGYGPIVADFESGEIISSTANLSTQTFYNSIQFYVLRYIESKIGFSGDLSRRLKTNGNSGSQFYSPRNSIKKIVSIGKCIFLNFFTDGKKLLLWGIKNAGF